MYIATQELRDEIADLNEKIGVVNHALKSMAKKYKLASDKLEALRESNRPLKTEVNKLRQENALLRKQLSISLTVPTPVAKIEIQPSPAEKEMEQVDSEWDSIEKLLINLERKDYQHAM